eukprot:jgi/Ulvmu1/10440/UM062_0037.1
MATELTAEGTAKAVAKMREVNPLVQCITNFVSMDIMANVLLAAGASPAMAHSLDEVEDFVGIASALLVNMGTLEPDWIQSMKLAASKCVELGKPWVLDPVAAGATPFRTASIKELLECKPTVIRGNAGEVMAVCGAAGTTKGVDSAAAVEDAHDAARALARDRGCVVAVSGEADFVTDGTRGVRVHNGTPMLTKITAAGCSLTALIAALCAVMPDDPLAAAVHGLAYFGLAGQLAAAPSPAMLGARKGPGTVRVGLLDELFAIDDAALVAAVKIEVME